MPDLTVAALAGLLKPFVSCRRWVIAYSGGLDSHVLLHVVAQLTDTPPLLAFHVNHGLHKQANAWERHCKQICEQLAVPHLARAVQLDKDSKGGLEDSARRARYRQFAAELSAGDLLLQAHHADDQAETMLLRLLRGAGTSALAGMPAERALGQGRLFRPFLAFSRADLQQYAQQHALRHIEDTSNFDTTLDRNYLRHKVMPSIRQRWPECTQSWLQSAAWLQESAAIAATLAEQDLAAAQWRAEKLGGSMNLAALRVMGLVRTKNAIRHACRLLDLPPPPQRQLQKLLTELAEAKADAQPRIVWESSEARRFAGRVHLLPRLVAVDSSAEYQWSGEDLPVPGVGIVRAVATQTKGLARNQRYTLRLRRGGEKFRPRLDSPNKPLKKWLQENRVPPWLRDRTPLIYKGEELVAIGELWVSENHLISDQAITVRVDTINRRDKSVD